MSRGVTPALDLVAAGLHVAPAALSPSRTVNEYRRARWVCALSSALERQPLKKLERQQGKEMCRVVESTRLDVERELGAAVEERELRRVDRLFPASLQVCDCVLGRRLAAYCSNYEL